MARVMAVTFEPHGRLYYLAPGDQRVSVGDRVLFPTEHGPEVATCVWPPAEVEASGLDTVPRCAGPASQADLERDRDNRRRRAEIKVVAARLIRSHQLPMKVVAVDWIDRSEEFDRQAVVYFTAPHRVDFRALVGELARALRARIDLRQVGVRDAAELIGGIGNCGRELCCATFLSSVEPVSMRMVKTQDLAPNPLRIAGACGRLMCCLRYEQSVYEQFTKEAPAPGERVLTEQGPGVVVSHAVPADEVMIKQSVSGEVAPCPKADACVAREAYLSSVRQRKNRRRGMPYPSAPGNDPASS